MALDAGLRVNVQHPTLGGRGFDGELQLVGASLVELDVGAVVRAIGSVHLHEGTGGGGAALDFLAGGLIDDGVVHGQIRHEVALAVAELGALLVGMDVGLEVEGSVSSLQAHGRRLHIDRLEVHSAHGQRAGVLILLFSSTGRANRNLFETGAGIGGRIGGRGVGRLGGGVSLSVGCGVGGTAGSHGHGHGTGEQQAEQSGQFLVLHHCYSFSLSLVN